MAVKRIAAETLIELAIGTIRTELAPGTGTSTDGERTYATAMVVNALEIARREVLSEGDSAQWKLLDTVYHDGEGNMRQLAADIRAGTINETDNSGLGQQLLAVIESELQIRNPRFLASRRAG
jgi:Domain of unknown function (DUF6285)